jgi:ribonuclease R
MTGRKYRLGDRLQVVVARVSMEDRKIDFDLADGDDKGEAGKTRRKGGKGRKEGKGGKGGKGRARKPGARGKSGSR